MLAPRQSTSASSPAASASPSSTSSATTSSSTTTTSTTSSATTTPPPAANSGQVGNPTTTSVAPSGSTPPPSASPVPGNGTFPGLPSADPGITTGAAAGIGIGCVALGIILAVLGFVVWLDRKKRKEALRRPRRAWSTTTPGTAMKPIGAAGHFDEHQDSQEQQSLPLGQFLLDSIPDKDLVFELRSLSQLIEQHVSNNYHDGRVAASEAELLHALHGLGYREASGNGPTPEDLAALVHDPRTASATRKTALRHVLSFVIFSSLDFSPTRSGLSMLPPPVMDFVRAIPQGSSRRSNSDATATAMSQWRALSAFLLHPKRHERSALSPEAHNIGGQAAVLVAAMDKFLAPFANAGGQHISHLQDVVVESAKLGYLLLSQPSDWHFEHSPGLGAKGGSHWVFVVCAGLMRVTGSDGRRAGRQRLVSPPEVLHA